MNRDLFLIALCLGLVLSSCEKNADPISSNDPLTSITDWEGNYPLINTACTDSILFCSDRCIGTAFAPSVYVMYKGGSGVRALTNQWFTFGASWSPRRWKIIFIADTGWGKPARGLFIMNSDGTNKKRVTPIGEDVFGTAAWSPDGNKIAYVEIDTSDQYGRGRVKLINPDGTNPKVLTDWFGQLRRITWSPDSRRIVFGGSDKLYIINTDGTEPSVLLNYSQGCYSPSWSPDGTLIAFSSFASIDNTYYSKIFTFNVNSRRIAQVTTGKSFDYDPTWSSDSKAILFSSSPPGISSGSSIYRIDINGLNLVRLTDSLGTDYNVSWFK